MSYKTSFVQLASLIICSCQLEHKAMIVEDTKGSVDKTLASDAFKSPDIDASCGQFTIES